MQQLIFPVIAVVAFSFFSNPASAQNYEKVWFDKTDSVLGYYTVIKPVGPRIQGAIVLFDGYGGDAVSFLAETKIHNVASVNDLMTICIPVGNHLFLDDEHMRIIMRILNEVAKKYNIKNDRFAMGGFSAGGVIALRYTELCYEHPEEFEIQPRALFSADSPVDLPGLYESSKKELANKSNGWWLGEARMIIDSFNIKLGGGPDRLPDFSKVTPFDQRDSLPGNEKWLVKVPYRTYHDVDVEWQIKNRQRSIYEMNMLNASELIRRLQQEGNDQAEFVASKIPGRRSSGQLHPHSWNIIDEIDLVSWVKEKLETYPGNLSKKYSYNAPGWGQELWLFPLDFAPDIPYNGFEELRFAPEWGKADSEEKWAYTIVWWLDRQYAFDENTVKKDLESYFTGLSHRRAVADKQDMKLWVPSKAQVKKTETASGDIATYSASLHSYDAHVTKKPFELYCKVHIKSCSDKQHTVLLIEASAFPTTQPVWTKLDKVNSDFDCTPR